MIITKLQGGLGNQLFQYAIGRSLAYINNTKLVLDTSGFAFHYNEHVPRSYMLDAYPIKAEIATEKQLNTIKNANWLNKLRLKRNKHYKQLVFDEIPPKHSRYKFTDLYVTPKPTHYYPEIMLKHDCDVILDGYWQSYKFFNNINDLILAEFNCKETSLNYNKEVLEKIKSTESVSIHFRRTDRVHTKADLRNFRFLDMAFYTQCVNEVKRKIDNPHLFIFSDDIEWCKQNVTFDAPITYMDAYNEYTDLYLMSKCKHNIIAHSTFSWWAAWMNNNKNKLVVCPEIWFSEQIPEDIVDMVPDTWIKI